MNQIEEVIKRFDEKFPVIYNWFVCPDEEAEDVVNPDDIKAFLRTELTSSILKAKKEAVLEFMGSQNFKDAMKVAEMDSRANALKEVEEWARVQNKAAQQNQSEMKRDNNKEYFKGMIQILSDLQEFLREKGKSL